MDSDTAQKLYDMKIESAARELRDDAACALRDVEDAICAAKNLWVIHGVSIVDTARLILDESHRRRLENKS